MSCNIKNPLKRRKEVFKYVKLADYPKALSLAEKFVKDYDNNVIAVATYAATLGDYAELIPNRKSVFLKRKAVKLLYKQTKRLRGQALNTIRFVRNEYYYHSNQFRKQYLLGVEIVRKRNKKGYYSQGVGASNYAFLLAKRGQKAFAKKWAKKAIRAWQEYIKFNPRYYNSYVHYALALGISGNYNKSNKMLDKAAKYSGKKPDYIEFVEVRSKIETLNLK